MGAQETQETCSTKIVVRSETDIPAVWPRFVVRKKSSVNIRASKGVEEFKVSWQDALLVSDPNADLIIIQPNGDEYPCKKDIFFSTYTPVPMIYTEDLIAGYKFVKSATSVIVPIPRRFDVTIQTLEGVLPIVAYPDYIAIGTLGELYANTKQFVDDNLEFDLTSIGKDANMSTADGSQHGFEQEFCGSWESTR